MTAFADSLMSLAYMAELGFVINLAYVELTKTRYVDRMREQMNVVGTTIKNVDSADYSEEDSRRINELNIQLENLLENKPKLRKEAWVIHEKTDDGDDVQQCPFFSGKVFTFFDKAKDKRLAELFLFISGLSIILITIFNYLEWLGFWIIHTWTLFFWILLIAILVPVGMIVMGRMMSNLAFKIVTSIKAKYTFINDKAIGEKIKNESKMEL